MKLIKKKRLLVSEKQPVLTIPGALQTDFWGHGDVLEHNHGIVARALGNLIEKLLEKELESGEKILSEQDVLDILDGNFVGAESIDVGDRIEDLLKELPFTRKEREEVKSKILPTTHEYVDAFETMFDIINRHNKKKHKDVLFFQQEMEFNAIAEIIGVDIYADRFFDD